MGKASRARRRDSKMARKRALKQQRRALYASLAGTSRKAKRQRRKSLVAGNHKHAHIMSDCGNVGCQRCYPPLVRVVRRIPKLEAA